MKGGSSSPDLSSKPVCILNENGFYQGFQDQIQAGLRGKHLSLDFLNDIFFAKTPTEAIRWCEAKCCFKPEQILPSAITSPESIIFIGFTYTVLILICLFVLIVSKVAVETIWTLRKETWTIF
mmetsp:Transcript_13585/g.17901  ORF Transcript_13585/g.17901 Transcript_13585/m.17901 type:complete len:123 (-) Transcript_13585:124-492(-)